MSDLTGKTALVTGAGGERGIGRAMAVRLAGEGADVAVNDRAEKPYADRPGSWAGLPGVVAEIRALGRRALGVVADVTDAAQVERMVERTAQDLGPIDVFIANAGSRPGPDRVPVVDLDEAAWDAVQRTNVRGTFLCCRAVARHMLARKRGGKIIVISSIAGKQGIARYAAYCASKFALIGLVQSLALELAPHNIQVNAICPGLVDTERVDHIAAALSGPGESAAEARSRHVRETAATVPLGRIARGEDIAGVAAFLASSDSDYLTGLSVNVAGGLLMD